MKRRSAVWTLRLLHVSTILDEREFSQSGLHFHNDQSRSGCLMLSISSSSLTYWATGLFVTTVCRRPKLHLTTGCESQRGVSVLAKRMVGHRGRQLNEVRRSPAGAPWADLGRYHDGQQHTQTKRPDKGPLPCAGAANLASGPAVEVSGREARRIDDMPHHVNGHGGNPQDEGRLVEEQELLSHAGRTEQQGDAGGHDRHREHDEKRSEKSEQRGRGSLAPVLGRSEVVASEPPRGAADLEENGGDQHHADHDVQGEEPSDPQDGEALDRQEHEEDDGGHAGQSCIGLHAVVGRFVVRSRRCRGRRVCGHGPRVPMCDGRFPCRDRRSRELGSLVTRLRWAPAGASHPSHISPRGTVLRRQRTTLMMVTTSTYKSNLTIG